MAMPESPEPTTWNQVKAMLEAQDKKISTIAEGIADSHPRIVRLEKTVDTLAEDMKFVRVALKTLTTDMKDVKDRLTTTETKLSA
jgi:archaellum component FlaC